MTADPRRTLVTMFAGTCETLRPVTLPPMLAYAGRHGYGVAHAAPAPDLPAAWGKVPALQAALEDHDVAVWVDADCLLHDHAPDVVDYFTDGAFQVLAEDDRFGVSTCIWALRATPAAREFLAGVWSLRHRPFGDWEQGAVGVLLDQPENAAGTVYLGEEWGDHMGCHPAPVAVHAGYQYGSHQQRADQLAARTALSATVILERTLDLLADPRQWACRNAPYRPLSRDGSDAQRADGTGTWYGDPGAASWCMEGALYLAAELPRSLTPTYPGPEQSSTEADREIDAWAPRAQRGWSEAATLLHEAADGNYEEFNDHRSHEDVVDAVTRARDAARHGMTLTDRPRGA